MGGCVCVCVCGWAGARTVEEMSVAFRAFDREASGDEIDSQELALSMVRMYVCICAWA